MTWRRWALRTGGAAMATGSGWLAWFGNVDTAAEIGPTNCGPNALRVVLDGPSRNQDVLRVADCRANAALNLAICLVGGAVGFALALGIHEVLLRRQRARNEALDRVVFRSVPQVVLLVAAVTVTGIALAGGAFRRSDTAGWAALLATIPCAFRAAGVRAAIDPSGVTIRNLCRTIHVALHDARRFEHAPTPWWSRPEATGRVVLVAAAGRRPQVTALGVTGSLRSDRVFLATVLVMDAELQRRKRAVR